MMEAKARNLDVYVEHQHLKVESGETSFAPDTCPRCDYTPGVQVYLTGLGTYGREYGAPLSIRWEDGKPMLRVYSDINKEEPTHVIDLSGACEVSEPNAPTTKE